MGVKAASRTLGRLLLSLERDGNQTFGDGKLSL
jgi:hypothetical protein